MMLIDCTIDAEGWGEQAQLEQLCHNALQAAIVGLKQDLPKDAEVSIVFSNDSTVQQLNREWRDQDKPTNVLSFAAQEGGGPLTPLLGDIVLALETVQREAHEQGKQFDHHLTHLVLHGFFHLLGHDHIKDEEAEIMEVLEVQTLLRLGIADPYVST